MRVVCITNDISICEKINFFIERKIAIHPYQRMSIHIPDFFFKMIENLENKSAFLAEVIQNYIDFLSKHYTNPICPNRTELIRHAFLWYTYRDIFQKEFDSKLKEKESNIKVFEDGSILNLDKLIRLE